MNDMMFTIIIPVYNTEKYLSKCLESIINQTYKNKFEVIIVNDGSTDNSSDIIEKYKNKIEVLKVINRENKGILYSRIEATKKAIGEYIIFLDSDDYLPNNALEIYSEYISEFKYDIIRGNYSIFDEKKCIKKCDDFKSTYEIIKDRINVELYRELLINNKFNSVWRQAIKRKKIKFNEKEIDMSITMGDDIIYNLECFANINNIKIVTENLYFYRINEKSITNDISEDRLKKNIRDLDKVYERIIKIMEDTKDEELIKLAYYSYLKIMNAYYFLLTKGIKNNSLLNHYANFIFLNKKTENARKILNFKYIRLKKRKIFIYLILKRKKKIYMYCLKLIAMLYTF